MAYRLIDAPDNIRWTLIYDPKLGYACQVWDTDTHDVKYQTWHRTIHAALEAMTQAGFVPATMPDDVYYPCPMEVSHV